MRWRPFNVPLDQVTEGELKELIQRGVGEGLFVEYKSKWSSEKVGRAGASFANTYGGTVVVGMEAEGLLPTRLVGMEAADELESRAVSVLRASVAPVPAFFPHAVSLESGRTALVVEVPEGRQTPYLWIPKGQILVRTPTSSEPIGLNDRDSLDRLYRRGERGQRWADQAAERLMSEYSSGESVLPVLWTIPEVEDGLGVQPLIHRESFFSAVEDLSRRSPYVSAGGQATPGMRPEFMEVKCSTIEREGYLQTRVYANGIVEQRWQHPQVGAGELVAEGLLEWGLPMQRRILEDMLGHRGDVTIAMVNRWLSPNDGPVRELQVVSHQVDMGAIASGSVLASLDRQLARSVGRFAFEPEA